MKPSSRWFQLLKSSQTRNPYLRAHAQNPVEWHLWSQDALQQAKDSNKPIFLSIGYHSCHWCHVMNRESFASEEVAAKLNSQFVPIKIDKEEFPDLDAIYMMYLQATTGTGGWPLNVFLTPELEPIFGGTYWAGPSVSQEILSSLKAVPFLNVLEVVSTQWKTNNETTRNNAQDISQRLRALVDSKTAEPVPLEGVVETANTTLKQTSDTALGGWGQAPKFPLPATLHYAIQQPELRDHALFTLDSIFSGGIKDQVGNGIARYSVTADWHLPHFEKMLCDQALVLHATLEDPSQHEFANDLVDFLVHGPLRSPEGGWFSAVDADSLVDGKPKEGAYYTWTSAEMGAALSSLKLFDRDLVMDFYGVNDNGNINADLDPHGEFKGQNILSKHKTLAQVAATFGRSEAKAAEIIAQGRALLHEARLAREAPAIDSKVVTGWNGAAISALARASHVLDRRDALSAALKAAAHLKAATWDGEQLMRTADGVPAVNDDYAYLIQGLLELYQATFDPAHLGWALELQRVQLDKFWDQRGGFYTSQNFGWLLFRPKATFDSAEPSSNGISLQNLRALASMTGQADFVHKAQQLLGSFSADIAAQPTGYLSLLEGLNEQPRCVAIVGDDAQAAAALLDEARGLALVERAPLIRVARNSVHLFGHCEDLWATGETRIELVGV